MKALQLIESGQSIQLREVDLPELSSNDVIVSVKAAGVCHSDVHYSDGVSYAGPLPLTLGHEVSGIIEDIGIDVNNVKIGDRVCVHYLVTCGHCIHCTSGEEQFCASVQMIGKNRDGGWAEKIIIPSRNVYKIPDSMPFDEAAIMMCSTSTSFHAIKKAKLVAGNSVSVFGVGGLGLSAIQLCDILGASQIFAVDISKSNLELAEKYGAEPINSKIMDPVQEIIRRTNGRGVDVSLELVGNPQTMKQAVQCLGLKGRAAIAGISEHEFQIDSYHQLINKEAEIVGVSDHTGSEIEELIRFYEEGKLKMGSIVTKKIPLDGAEIDNSLKLLRKSSATGRTVIEP